MSTSHQPSTDRGRRLFLGAAAASLLAITAIAWGWEGSRPEQSITFQGLSWNQGEEQHYDVRFATQAAADATSNGARHELRGALAMRVFEVSDERVEVGFALTDVRYVAAGTRDAGHEQALMTPFAAEFAPDGAILGFRHAAGLDPDVGTQLEEMVQSFATVVPERAGATWTAVQTHASGTYRAAYERDSASSVRKQKMAYLEGAPLFENGQVVGSTQTRVDASAMTVTLDPKGSWIRSAVLEEKLVFESEAGVLARVSVRARLEPAAHAVASRLAEATSTRDLIAVPVVAEHTPVAQAPRAVEPKQATPEVTAQFRATLAEFALSEGDDMVLLHRLAAMVEEFPELAAIIPEQLQTGLQDRVAAGLIHVLELAGHEQSQNQLLVVLTDEQSDRRNALRAIAALGGVAAPTEDTVEALWHVAQSRDLASGDAMADAALLSLGQAGQTLRNARSSLYPELAQRLLDSLSTGSAQASANALKAIGNTGDTELAPHVASRLEYGEPAVRAAAAHTLGKLDAPDSLGDLTNRLRAEPDGRVRAVIAGSLRRVSAHDRSTFELCASLVENEQDADARGAMARYLADNLDAFEDAAPTLERLIASETDPQTLSYVAGRLYRRQ